MPVEITAEEKIKTLEAAIKRQSDRILELEGKIVQTEIDVLKTYRSYDLKVAEITTDLAIIRAYVIEMKQKSLAAKAKQD